MEITKLYNPGRDWLDDQNIAHLSIDDEVYTITLQKSCLFEFLNEEINPKREYRPKGHRFKGFGGPATIATVWSLVAYSDLPTFPVDYPGSRDWYLDNTFWKTPEWTQVEAGLYKRELAFSLEVITKNDEPIRHFPLGCSFERKVQGGTYLYRVVDEEREHSWNGDEPEGSLSTFSEENHPDRMSVLSFWRRDRIPPHPSIYQGTVDTVNGQPLQPSGLNHPHLPLRQRRDQE